MKTISIFATFAWLICAGDALAEGDLTFAAVDVYLDAPDPVAAWQFELNDQHGLMKVVGVENGDSAAYTRAPYYDREAVRLGRADRIVVADYSLADTDELPVGRTRIATVHLMLDGLKDDDIKSTLITATTHDGRVIDATISLVLRSGSES